MATSVSNMVKNGNVFAAPFARTSTGLLQCDRCVDHNVDGGEEHLGGVRGFEANVGDNAGTRVCGMSRNGGGNGNVVGFPPAAVGPLPPLELLELVVGLRHQGFAPLQVIELMKACYGDPGESSGETSVVTESTTKTRSSIRRENFKRDGESMASVPGYCYLRLFRYSKRGEVRTILGPYPNLLAIMAQNPSWFATADWRILTVTGAGTDFHLTYNGNGRSFSAAIAATLKEYGRVFPPGILVDGVEPEGEPLPITAVFGGVPVPGVGGRDSDWGMASEEERRLAVLFSRSRGVPTGLGSVAGCGIGGGYSLVHVPVEDEVVVVTRDTGRNGGNTGGSCNHQDDDFIPDYLMPESDECQHVVKTGLAPLVRVLEEYADAVVLEEGPPESHVTLHSMEEGHGAYVFLSRSPVWCIGPSLDQYDPVGPDLGMTNVVMGHYRGSDAVTLHVQFVDEQPNDWYVGLQVPHAKLGFLFQALHAAGLLNGAYADHWLYEALKGFKPTGGAPSEVRYRLMDGVSHHPYAYLALLPVGAAGKRAAYLRHGSYPELGSLVNRHGTAVCVRAACTDDGVFVCDACTGGRDVLRHGMSVGVGDHSLPVLGFHPVCFAV